jgi:uncharacterized protein (TIGR02145 family)
MKTQRLLFVLLFSISYEMFSQDVVKDNEGNVYKTIQIGLQVWMQENLRTTHYNNGDQITTLKDAKAWGDAVTGMYSVYEDKMKFKNEFGLLYNYYAITDNRKVCPIGWHIPSDSEFVQLILFLGGNKAAGGKLKESGTAHWLKPNTGQSNVNTFMALPAGIKTSSGGYYGLTTIANFWSMTSTADFQAIAISLECYSGEVKMNSWFKAHGFNVRCLKD